jgi:hypothetical protein
MVLAHPPAPDEHLPKPEARGHPIDPKLAHQPPSGSEMLPRQSTIIDEIVKIGIKPTESR